MGAGSSSDNNTKDIRPIRIPDIEDGYPPPKPPISKKQDVFKPDDFEHIDNHARTVPAKHSDYGSLLDQLFHDLKSDLQMVRAIFVWLGSQRIDQLKLGNVTDPETPVGYMRLIQRQQGSYAAFFAQICRAAKIPCVVVRGKGKAVGYEVGDEDITNLNCKWTAVYVGQQWRLIHPLWAFTGVQGQNSGKWTLIEKKGEGQRTREGESKGSDVRTCDDFFFLTDPEQFIYFCRPNDDPWQLLDKQLSEKEFINSPCFTPAYFTSGLKYMGESGNLVAHEGKEAVRFEHAKDKNLGLSYELYCDEEESEEQLPDSIELERYVLENTQKTKKSLFLRFPVAGIYKLRVFGGTGPEKKMPHIADYRIKCAREAKNPNPFPLQKDIGYGYGHEAKDAGLVTTSAYSGIVVLEHGQKMTFNFDVDRPVEFQTKLHHRNMTPYELEKYLETKVTNKNAEVTVTMPEEGLTPDSEYALEINTRESDSHDSFRNVCNYFLTPDKKQWKSDSDAVANKSVVRPVGRPARTQTKIQQKPARSESPRRRMRSATGGEDIDELERTIREFEKSGLDEKDEDYTKAKARLLKLRNDANRDETPRYRMRDATKGDSIEDLERTIEDFENSDLDEKDKDLTKAKERLAQLKKKKEEEDAIRKRMRDATDEDSIEELEKSIRAFEDAGLDEQDEDLTRAKERLAKLKNDEYQEQEKVDESAREAMRDATDYGSAAELEKAIKDFENSGLDEKDRDLTKAKERLAQLKDNENQNSDNDDEELRQKLADAVACDDMDAIDKALQDCKDAGLSDKGDITEAEQKLMDMHKEKLEEAKRERDAEKLQKALEEAEQSAVANKLDDMEDYQEAKETNEQIVRVKKFNQQVLELNPRLVSEIASYKRPKPCIQDVMTATYVILHDKPDDSNWQSIVKRMKSVGQKNIIRRVGQFDIVHVTPEQAHEAGKLIDPYDLDDVMRNSKGAGTFYKWTRDVVKEVKCGGKEE